MNNQEKNDYCIISKEIVVFLEWLLSQEDTLIDSLIKRAWKKGFKHIYAEKKQQLQLFDEYAAQQAVIDFFSLLDEKLESIAKKETAETQKNIQKTIENGFSFFLEKNEPCNTALEKSLTHINLEDISNKNIVEQDKQKSLFFKQFLKNWNTENAIVE
jgi:hypothetical protein